jgi:HPt (histidine-containing phosphotransfer) domain-containing protein
MSSLEVLDPSALERLEAWGGAALVARMIDLFLDLGEDRLEQIRSGTRDGEVEQVERAAHSLKSSAANLGAQRLRAAAAALEAAAIAREHEDIERLSAALPDAYAETVTQLKQARPELEEDPGS